MSEFWLREIKVNVAGLEFIYPDIEIQFRMEFDDTDDPDIAVVELYNLKRETENKIKKGEQLILSAGYQGDIGTVIAGEIAEVYSRMEGVDRICEIEVVDATEAFLRQRISKTYKEGITASQVLADVLDKTGLEIGAINLPDDVTYDNGRTVDGRLKEVARQIVDDGGGKLYINNGTIFAVPKDFGQDVGVFISKESGLLHSPTRVDSDDAEWDIESLLNYRIRAGAKVKVESETANGLYRVIKGEHRSGGGEHSTRIEVAEA